MIVDSSMHVWRDGARQGYIPVLAWEKVRSPQDFQRHTSRELAEWLPSAWPTRWMDNLFFWLRTVNIHIREVTAE
jgi:hypothetical protein